MKDQNKTKKQLTDELIELRQRLTEVDPDGRLAYLSPNDKETVGYDPGEHGARRGAISWEQKARALIPGL